MRIETIRDRLQKAQEKVDKKRGTIERKTNLIAKKQKKLEALTDENERRWAEFDIENLKEDIVRLRGEFDKAFADVQKYTEALAEAEEKERSRNCRPILEFLERWKKQVTDYYHRCADKWQEEGEAFKAEKNQALEQARSIMEWREYRKVEDQWYRKEVELDKKYAFLRSYKTYYCSRFDDKRLEADLDYEAKVRYDQLIDRVREVAGEIVDASGLGIGAKGDLEGYIIGSKGCAEVFTIGAGGYNIQCFHYRTLVKER